MQTTEPIAAATATPLVAPLGGVLVDRRVRDEAASELRAHAAALPAVHLRSRELADLRLLGNGAYSPLRGFMSRADHEAVVDGAALADGTPWTLPITLTVTADEAEAARRSPEVALVDDGGTLRGVLRVADVFERDLQREAREVYRTEDVAHPGVAALFAAGAHTVGGEVTVLDVAGADALDIRKGHLSASPRRDSAPARLRLALDPAQTRALMQERGWTSVVAFQTRNPVHRAHEYLTKVALEQVDGLLLHPLVGDTKDDDVPAAVRMRCYEVLLQRYYPPERVLLATFPAAMRYAGPREAVYHGLVRRNYGCSHFIIGRDAAGVGSYYGTYDAQALYDELGGAARLGYAAFKFEHTFWCNACEGMASTRTCPHGPESRVVLSGTAVRKLLAEGGEVPHTFTRPEVGEVLRAAYAGNGRAQ